MLILGRFQIIVSKTNNLLGQVFKIFGGNNVILS